MKSATAADLDDPWGEIAYMARLLLSPETTRCETISKHCTPAAS